ncbi:hypothetical protein ASPCADRAFT_161658 [Aspergillus carbonarius ITEM 5010]|uniref:OPT family small oligopeptide transporter n=1 Tax=Aspergillus carbonarius (strain ITEM 5010) TaxID=602072 RepID=A0A1R3S093_ASPC5|nr:hypothetical protein ASPCADRAFT_161658 [Aspergillus carbonarius ITEM 5010]
MADEVTDSPLSTPVETNEKKPGLHVQETADIHDVEVAPGFVAEADFEGHYKEVPVGEGIVPDDNDEFIDPRLKDYPIPLVAKTVDLRNDPTEPILTFRFWTLSTFWVLVGCALSTFYYFKPYYNTITSYAVQLLSWGMGDAMAKYLPKRQFNFFGWKWTMNPGPWNAKEHALIVVAYWGSCYTAYGMGPLSAIELYYGQKLNAGWSMFFLLASQMIGYGFAGLFRDILVRPPQMYYPGVLPNVSLFNAMHKNPSVTKKALKYFAIVASVTFVYEWLPELIFPLLGSLPLICWFGHGNWKAFVLGSGTYGFGMLDLSLDWNYITFMSPYYTPLWSSLNQGIFAMFCCWVLYPLIYFTNTMNAQNFAPMDTGTYTANGSTYDVTAIVGANMELNRTALAEYGAPYWAPSYVFYWFWTFAALTASMAYAILWYGKSGWRDLKAAWQNKRSDYDDPYLKMMSFQKRVPHWWYLTLLVICAVIAIAQGYEGNMKLSWWGFVVICLFSFVFTWPNGILWAVANIQVGMGSFSDLLAGAMFPGKPTAVLSAYTYGYCVLEQNLNLISDYKFGFYMKIPEREMFWGQVWGTVLGPFINYGFMQLIVDRERPFLIGQRSSEAWDAVQTRVYYSNSIIWGILGPKEFFVDRYPWVYYSFVVGAGTVIVTWLVQKWKPKWDLERWFNPTLLFYGGYLFPYYPTTNFFMSFLACILFMGILPRYFPVWWRKYNYLTGVGLDCGTQLMTLICIFVVNLPNLSFPSWWGNDPNATDRCFPPADLPANALN